MPNLPEMSALAPKADMESPMSVFGPFTSVVGGKADIIRVGVFVCF